MWNAHSASYATKRATTTTLKKGLFAIFTAVGIFCSQTVMKTETAHAALPPDTCFTLATDPYNGTNTTWITGYTIGGPNNCPSDVTVPETIGGKTVVGAGLDTGQATYTFDGVTSLTLPNTLKYISSLGKLDATSLIIPASVQHFSACSQYAGEPAITCTDDTLPNGGINYVSSVKPMTLSFGVESQLAMIPDSSFYNSNLTGSLVLPDGVTMVGSWAFSTNNITSLSLPNTLANIFIQSFAFNKLSALALPASVKLVDSDAFTGNRLISLALNDGLLYLNSNAFAFNQLTSVKLPSTLKSLGGSVSWNGVGYDERGMDVSATNDSSAFFNQSANPDAGYIYQNVPLRIPCDPNFYTGTYVWPHTGLTDLQSCESFVSTKFWYAQLYTADPTNPQGFQDSPGGSFSGVAFGGHLINPASNIVRYVDSSGKDIAPALTQTGTGLITYYAADNTTNDLTRYYRLASFAYSGPGSAPTIVGYVTPTTYTDGKVLGVYTSTYVYYTQAEINAKNAATLAKTGIDVWVVLSIAGGMLGAAGVLYRKSLRSAPVEFQ